MYKHRHRGNKNTSCSDKHNQIKNLSKNLLKYLSNLLFVLFCFFFQTRCLFVLWFGLVWFGLVGYAYVCGYVWSR